MSYSSSYSNDGFWTKLATVAGTAGRELLEKALTLYHCMRDADTPAWAKSVIVGALAYFICPLDAIPDFLVPVGYVDDLGALATAFGTVVAHVKDDHVRRARAWVDDVLG